MAVWRGPTAPTPRSSIYGGDLEIPFLNQALKVWEQTYNTIRPHQSLDGKTPAEYLMECHPGLAQKLSHM